MSRRLRRKAKVAPSRPMATDGWWHGAMIALAGVLAYANSLSGPFVFDDKYPVLDNPAIRQWSSIHTILAQPINSPLAGRPVSAFSLAINFALGGAGVTGYHLVNIGIHICCGLLLFGVVRRTLSSARIEFSRQNLATPLAFAVALCWTLHPLNTEAVDYVIQRTESMMALFYLLTLYASIRALAAKRSVGWQALSVTACALGMASKEVMVTAPVIVFLYDRIFVFDSLGEAVRTRWRLYGGLGLTWLILAYLMLPGPRSSSVGFGTVTPWTYLLNQAVMIARYLRLAVWPARLVVDYGPAVPRTLSDVWPQIVLIAALVSLTLVALVRCPPLGFLGAWVFIILAPTSSIIPIATEVGAERRMYVPLMAIVALLVIGVYRLMAALRYRRVVGIVALAVVASALGIATVARNREYRTALSLANTMLARWPIPKAHLAVGAELGQLGRHDDAIAELQMAADVEPLARYDLGVELYNAKRFDDALRELRKFASEHQTRAEVPTAHTIIGEILLTGRRWKEAIGEFRLVLSMLPADPEARTGMVAALTGQGIELANAGHLDDALDAFRRASTLDPSGAGVHDNLARALFEKGDPVAAAAEARQAVTLNPAHADSHDLLGRLLATQGEITDAIAEFEWALRLDPHNPVFQDDLRRTQAFRSQKAVPPERR